MCWTRSRQSQSPMAAASMRAIERAMSTFISVRKRMEIKGEANGVLVVEDFAHHPTAIRMTLDATRTRWPGRKIWAAVEPRSNTMRRKIFQHVLPDALAVADAIVIGPVSRAQLLEEGDRLSPNPSLSRSSSWASRRGHSIRQARSWNFWRPKPSREIW